MMVAAEALVLLLAVTSASHTEIPSFDRGTSGGMVQGMTVQPCRPQLENQSWTFAGGALRLAGSPALCATYGGDGVPLVMEPCNASSAAQRWTWVEAHGAIELAHPPGSTSPACADIRGLPGNGGVPGDVGGYYPCHFTAGLPSSNEGWKRGADGRITATTAPKWKGRCLTGPEPPQPPPPPPPPPPDLQSGLNVWPIPRGEERASGPPLALARSFVVRYTGGSGVARAAAARYSSLIRNKTALYDDVPGALTTLNLVLASDDDAFFNWHINESYTLTIQNASATINASTPFGGLRGLETFYQLLPNASARTIAVELPHDKITIVDEPAYPWRSLMIDTGRRLFPLSFVRSIIDAMAMAKLNVLQLHMNDMGRFAWESKVFPELNVGYDTDTRYWKQDDIRHLLIYAKERGVRLVPEIEMSTHAKALLPLVKTQGLTFCNSSFPVMLFDDPGQKTFVALKKLVTEMAGLFPDSVLHVGMDEAQCHYSEQSSKDPLDVGMCGLQSPPRCNQDTVRELQHKLLTWVSSELLPHRIPMAWHNAYTDCGDLNGCGKPGAPPASTQGIPNTIVQVFAGSSIGNTSLTAPELLANVTKAGYHAVMADAGRLYLDTGSTNPTAYRNSLWDDIAMGLTEAQLPLVLGGSMPLWSDNYCSGTVECGGWAYCPGAPWPAHAPFPTSRPGSTCPSSLGWMQSSEQDMAFTLSAGGLLFPRANFGAGAFWNYRHDVTANSAEMLRRTDALAASMKERGVVGLCEPGCSCSFGSRCGVAYKPSFANVTYSKEQRKAGQPLKHDDDDGGSETTIGVTLSKDGFFLRNGTHFYPIGLNYWPASTGCNLWTAETFPGVEIQHDLDILAASPFNSLRIFLEWGALEPSEGTFDEAKFRDLAVMLGWISQRRLLVDISTFVGWMSGRHYWPSWKRNRNMYTDATMINRSVAFAAKVAKTAAPFKSSLLAMEYGNEMNCCTDKAPPEAVIAWTHKIYDAFKMNAGTSVLVVPGTDENTIIGSTGWPLGGVTGRIAGDILNFHPYPVLFSPTKGDGFFDTVTQAGPTYDGSFVRAFGPSFMQEWGTLVTGGVRQQDAYLRKILPESLENGVCGWLYWCMRDIDNNQSAPYNTTGLETALGLFNDDDTIKPGLTYYADFAREIAEMTAPNSGKPLPEADPDAVGLYVPLHYYELGDSANNPGNRPSEQSGHATIAYALLRKLGESTRVIRGDRPLPHGADLKVLVVTSSILVAVEIDNLSQYVKTGGKLIWHGLSAKYFTGAAKLAAESLVGANCVGSLDTSELLQVTFGSALWNMPTSAYLQGNMTSAARLGEPREGTKIWSSNKGHVPMMTLSKNNHTGGAVFASVAAVDTITLALMGQPSTRDAWAEWFRHALSCVRSGCAVDDPVQRPRASTENHMLIKMAHAPHAQSKAWEMNQPQSLPKIALVYGNGAAATVALKELSDLSVHARSIPVPVVASSFGNATVLLVEQSMSLPDMDVTFAWLRELGKGRCIIWSGFSASSLNRELYTSAGVAAVDIRTALPSSVYAFGRRFDFNISGDQDLIEFSVKQPVQRSSWGAAEVVATDNRGIDVLHRHQHGGALDGVFVMSSLSAELASEMPASDRKAWFTALLSLCSNRTVDGGHAADLV